MNLTLISKPGLLLANSSPGMRDRPDTALIPQDYWTDQTNASLLTRDTNTSANPSSTLIPTVYDPLGGHSIWQVIIIVLLTGSLSLITITGNILVLASFKVNKQLKTVNNYYLLSLAFADLIIGVLSMNLYTTYIIMGKWALGNWACDLWLAIDYVASNASVMNLLVISFDRYFSVTRPLTYRVKRTTKRAMVMIGLAWVISFVLWAPAILFWQYFEGKRTVPPGECHIQFLTEPIITFCTAIAAFYLPVTIMTVLYWRIYKETENRSKDLAGLKGSGNQAKPGSQEESAEMMPPTDCAQNKPKKASIFRFLLLSRGGRKRHTAGDPEHSSSDSWNNNDQSEEEEEDAETSAIYSVIDPECADMEKTLPKDFSKLSTQSPPSVQNSKTSSMASKSSSTLFCSKDDHKTKAKGKKVSLVREKKAAQTLSAILLAFIITWTPYNIMVLVNTFCNDCIPGGLWALGYWLCYVNSTVNPMCYALCNKNFRTTFRMILLCQWYKRKQNKPPLPQRNPVVAYRKKEFG